MPQVGIFQAIGASPAMVRRDTNAGSLYWLGHRDANKAVLSSLFDFGDVADALSVDLYFGPTAPGDHRRRWVQTRPGAGWFVYFRIYGPESPAFDGTWEAGDFEPTN